MQYRAPDAVACSLLALAFHFDEPEVAVQAAVHYGGDTDTIPCMTGALAGALHGRTWLPQRWLSQLENGAAGRDEVLRLATDLANLDVRGMARGPVRIEFTASIVSVNFVDPHTRVAQHICTFKTVRTVCTYCTYVHGRGRGKVCVLGTLSVFEPSLDASYNNHISIHTA